MNPDELTPAELNRPGPHFFSRGAVEVAQDLIGCYLLRELPGADGPTIHLGGRIVETEAYTAEDPASHSYPGKTARNGSMFEEGGTLYVYLIYGVHRCLNVVTGPAGQGEAVLFRALEPVWGVNEMARLRGVDIGQAEAPPRDRRLKGIADGPGKIAQALGVTGSEDGTSLLEGPLKLLLPPEPMNPGRIAATERIGITKGVEKKWRFVDSESTVLSRRLRA